MGWPGEPIGLEGRMEDEGQATDARRYAADDADGRWMMDVGWTAVSEEWRKQDR
jgi:hypothetical protein